MRLLLVVTETLTIPTRGIVLLPELKLTGGQRVKVGDPLVLRRPDGTETSASIGGLEFLKPLSGKCLLVIMLRGMVKEDAPAGTEVWLASGENSWPQMGADKRRSKTENS